jgi:hypothetical protein
MGLKSDRKNPIRMKSKKKNYPKKKKQLKELGPNLKD